MNKELFPSMRNIVGFNKEERDYLKHLLWVQLLELSTSVADAARSEEKMVQSILDKIKDQ